MTREDFAEWVASEIFSDDWEVNKNSFEEIACRKLVKLGIVEQIDGHYRLNNERENKKMTREEAIKRLDEQAFKALEQEPCGKDINVPATDCISRQMAIDALGECPMNWTDSDDEITAERDWLDTVKMLKSLPSVTPQPKTDVLDKIRAEVKALPNANPSYSGYIDVVDREDVLEIIDKYKSESEVDE